MKKIKNLFAWKPVNIGPVRLTKFPTRTKQEVKLIDTNPFGDTDKDGVPNWFDCKPLDRNKQSKMFRKEIIRRVRIKVPKQPGQFPKRKYNLSFNPRYPIRKKHLIRVLEKHPELIGELERRDVGLEIVTAPILASLPRKKPGIKRNIKIGESQQKVTGVREFLEAAKKARVAKEKREAIIKGIMLTHLAAAELAGAHGTRGVVEVPQKITDVLLKGKAEGEEQEKELRRLGKKTAKIMDIRKLKHPKIRESIAHELGHLEQEEEGMQTYKRPNEPRGEFLKRYVDLEFDVELKRLKPSEREKAKMMGPKPEVLKYLKKKEAISPYNYQDTHQEKVIHSGWKKGNVYRAVLMGAGDIFRGLTKDKDWYSPEYVDEKLTYVENYLKKAKKSEPYFKKYGIIPEDSFEYSKTKNPKKFEKLKETWEKQPTFTKSQELTKELNLALLNKNLEKARELTKHIRKETKLEKPEDKEEPVKKLTRKEKKYWEEFEDESIKELKAEEPEEEGEENEED